MTGESHDLQRVPRLHQHVVLALRLFELGVEVVARLLELLAVGHVFEPQLILALHRQLLHLLLELRHRLQRGGRARRRELSPQARGERGGERAEERCDGREPRGEARGESGTERRSECETR